MGGPAPATRAPASDRRRRVAPVTVLEPLAEEYLTWLAVDRGRAANTVAAYRRDLAAYQRYVHGRGMALADVGVGDVDTYLARRVADGASAASLARAVAAIRGLHRFAADETGSGADPTADVAGPRLAPRLPRALPEEDVASLLDGVSGTDPRSRRDRAVLEVLYGTGMRVGELVGLDVADLGADSGLVRVLGKGRKERLVPLTGAAAEALARWLAPEGRGAMVPARWARGTDREAAFLNTRGGRLTRQGVWGLLVARAEAAGLTGEGRPVHPHVLRHSCATHMLAHGADLRVVQELLGHASVATTQLYTKVTPEHLRRAYEAAHPRAAPVPGTRR